MLTRLNHLAPHRFLLDGNDGAGGGAGGAGGSGAGAPPSITTPKFLDFDLPNGVKVPVPEEAIKPLATWRDGIKGELAKLSTLQTEVDQLRSVKTQADKAAADLVAAQTQVTALTAKVTELEQTKASAEASEGALAKILEARMAQVPESMKGLVKGTTTLEKLQSYEDLHNAGVFKVPNPAARLPGVGTAQEMTYDEFNAQPTALRASLQQSIREGKLKLVEKRAV